MVDNYFSLKQTKKQIALEFESRSLGVSRLRSTVSTAQEKERESLTPYGLHLIQAALAPVIDGLEAFIRHVEKGGPGRRAIAYKYLKQLEPEVAAFLSLKVCLDLVSGGASLVSVAFRIARYLEDEVRFAEFKRKAKPLFDKVLDQTADNIGYSHKSTIFRVVCERYEINKEWEKWPKSDRAHVGMKMVDIILETTGYFELIRQTARKRSRLYLVATKEAQAFIYRDLRHCELMSPMLLPTVVPPKPWESSKGGAYYTSALPPVSLVKSYKKDYQQELEARAPDLKRVFEAVNAIQETPWKINQPVYEVLDAIWNMSGGVAGLPPCEDQPLPPTPPDIKTNKKALADWKKVAKFVYKKNVQLASKRLQVAKTLWVARKFKDEPNIWFPHNLDFRGRVYPIPPYLTPQGPDYARSLLVFSRGKPLGTPEAVQWLAVHGANCWGEDKLPLAARQTWVEEHTDQIVQTAKAPLDYRWWMDADEPWQFLAFCFEWAGYKAEGLEFVSHLPIAMDGSCNGLQHFSAMLRDEVGGLATNLVPTSEPQDIYAQVADKVVEKLEAIAESESDDNTLAKQLLHFGVNRKTCKRPVMILPYGGTRYACCNYVEEYMMKSIEEGNENPWGLELPHAARFLGDIVWESIGDIVIAPQRVMDWLRTLARQLARKDIPIVWTNPVGFPMLQAYPNLGGWQIRATIGGAVVRPWAAKEIGGVDSRRQVNGISPNIVHSCDAAALMLTVLACKEQGLRDFAMIHDSYGTLAADAEVLAATLRREFVQMYEEHDILAEIAKIISEIGDHEIEVGPQPDKGKLDIRGVLESEFFFA